jgi:putative DNA primase/helicase
MLRLGVYPAHLGPGFLEFYRGMVNKRLEAKAKGNRITADALKIAINSVFGKMGYEFFWLYDPRAFLSVTINGQLFLLDLIEKLQGAGISTLSANTDGVLCAIPPELEGAYTAVCEDWQERTGFSLEFSDYSRVIRRDVNNYMARTEDGRIKAKGIFIENRNLSDSFRAPIIARAIREYFLNGTPPEETLEAEKSPLPFCYVFKPGKQFRMVYETPGKDIEAPRVNRYVIAKAGGTLIKLSKDRRDRVRTQPMILLNGELPEERPEGIDLGFYVEEARKVIEKIEGKNLPLLSLMNEAQTAVSNGSLVFGEGERERLSKAAKMAPTGPAGAPRVLGLESSYSVTEIADSMGALPEGDSFRAPCPYHEGRDSRSLKITERDGRIDLHCFLGCAPEDILKEIERRLDSGETFRKPEAEPLGELVTTYEYRDEFGRISFRKHRYEPKTFRIDSYDPDSGEFLPGLNGHRPILYRYPELKGSDKVIIVEGEKDSDNGRALGIPGYAFTCNFDGAGKWARAYSQALAGKEIVIIPDNDPPGKDHGRKVSNSIAPFAKSVRVLELPEGKDLSDWIELGHTAEELQELIDKTEPIKAGELFEERDLLDYPVGDPGNAKAVLRLYGDRIAFTDGFGPMYYDRGFWAMGGTAEAEINRAIEDTLWRIREAVAKARDTKLEPLSRGAYPTSSKINSTRAMLKNYRTVTEDRFGNPPGLINAQNGVIDLRTGALYPAHSEYGFTYALGIPYVPGTRSQAWEEFLEETLPNPEEREYLQELIGYVFSGETREEIVIYISGPTRSGKGTFSETLQYLGGPLAHEINIRSLTDTRSGSDQNFDLAGLYHARFVHASESKDTDWLDSAKLKALSGGNWVRAAFKGKNLFTYRPQYTVLITSNEPPKMKAEDSAAWYRLKALEFPISKAGAEDKRLKSLLRDPEHITAVLNWVIEGSVRWYARPQGLITPESVKERTAGFRDSLDYIGEFLLDHYEISEQMSDWDGLRESKFYTPLDFLYEEYRSWYEDNGAPDLKKTTFGGKVRARLGGINLYTNQCRVRIEDPVTGEKKLTRVIAGLRAKGAFGSSPGGANSPDFVPY